MALTQEDLRQIQQMFQSQLKPVLDEVKALKIKVENLTKDVDKIKKLEGL